MLIIAYGPLHRFAESLLGSSEDAKDVVQEVLINVWRLGDRWDPSGSAIAYLFASVRNQAVKSRKSRFRFNPFSRVPDRSYEEAALASDIEDSKDQLEEIIDDEIQRSESLRVDKVLNSLSERY